MAYYISPEYGFSSEGEAMIDVLWKCKLPADVIDCPLVNVLEDATILDISYSMILEPLSKHMLVEHPKCPTQLLIYKPWNYISPKYDFDRAIIYTNKQECITIHLKDGKCECIFDDHPVNSIRDLRDWLDDSTIKIYYVNGSVDYRYVNDLYITNTLKNANNLAVMVDDVVITWLDGRWNDEEYLESHK